MTSESEFAKFKKVTGDKFKSHLNPPLKKEELEDEVLTAAQEAKEEVIKDELKSMVKPSPPQPAEPAKVNNRALVRRLRKNDRHFNHTCAVCLKRLPLEAFVNGKKSDVSIACGGK